MPARMIGPRRPNGSFFKKRPATRKPRPAKATPGLTKVVKAIINQQEETKYIRSEVLRATQFNSQIASASECYGVMPAIGLGVAPYQRVGDKITFSHGRVDFHLGFSQADTTARDITAVVYMLRCKSVRAARLSGSIPITNLLEGGGVPSTSFDGTISNAQLTVAKENFQVLTRKVVHLQKVDTTDVLVTSQNANSSAKFSIPIKVNKKLSYDDTLDGSYASNDYVFFCVGYYYNSPDHVPDVLGTALLITATSHVWYKDA